MLLTLSVRHLLLATWEVEPASVARSLRGGLRPALAGDRALVSIATFRSEDGRLGRIPVPSFSQVSVRTYVVAEGEIAVFFLQLRVTLPGMGGALFGAPFRPARIRVSDGLAEAPGLGVSFRYRRQGPPRDLLALEGGPLGWHEIGYFEAAGLRQLVARHEPCAWEEAELVETPRYEPLLALGFDVPEPASVLYAGRTDFRVELPPHKVA